MKDEIWKSIPGFDGMYEVSNKGRVRSWKNSRGSRLRKPKYLKPSIGTHGYLTYGLHKNNKTTGNGCVHRLVAEAFISNPENHPCINHKNGVKTDNRIENLEWCTYQHNTQHAFENGLITLKSVRGEDHGMAELTWREVNEIRVKFNSGKHSQSELAELYNISISNIGAIIKNKGWYDENYKITNIAKESFNKPATHLSDEEVLEIRTRYKKEEINQKELAHRYGVEAATISCIIRNEMRYDKDYDVPLDKLKRRKRYVGKLLEENVLDIRERFKKCLITQKELAEEYGIDPSTVSKIINRKAWNHI